MRLPIRAADRHIFDAIVSGEKRIETRAATPRYAGMTAGAEVTFACGGKTVTKKIAAVKKYASVDELLKHESPGDILPGGTRETVMALYEGFVGYRGKIARYGLIALELV